VEKRGQRHSQGNARQRKVQEVEGRTNVDAGGFVQRVLLHYAMNAHDFREKEKEG
jgi:hypothetical protein